MIARDGQSGPLFPGAAEVSDDTHRLVDQEVRRIVDEAHDRVTALLAAERGRLDSLAGALLEHETLDQDDAYAAVRVDAAKAADGDKARETAAAAAARMVSSDG